MQYPVTYNCVNIRTKQITMVIHTNSYWMTIIYTNIHFMLLFIMKLCDWKDMIKLTFIFSWTSFLFNKTMPIVYIVNKPQYTTNTNQFWANFLSKFVNRPSKCILFGAVKMAAEKVPKKLLLKTIFDGFDSWSTYFKCNDISKCDIFSL